MRRRRRARTLSPKRTRVGVCDTMHSDSDTVEANRPLGGYRVLRRERAPCAERLARARRGVVRWGREHTRDIAEFACACAFLVVMVLRWLAFRRNP